MDEALSAAKELRKNLSTEPNPPETPQAEAHLTVLSKPDAQEKEAETQKPPPSQQTAPVGRPTWVRHTVGLRSETSLKLRDAAEAQKRKVRYGTLGADEPANEQEIADLGIALALKQLGLD